MSVIKETTALSGSPDSFNEFHSSEEGFIFEFEQSPGDLLSVGHLIQQIISSSSTIEEKSVLGILAAQWERSPTETIPLTSIQELKKYDISYLMQSISPFDVCRCMAVTYFEMYYGNVSEDLKVSLRSAYWLLQQLHEGVKQELGIPENVTQCSWFSPVVGPVMQQALQLLGLRSEGCVAAGEEVTKAKILSQLFIALNAVYSDFLTHRIAVLANDQEVFTVTWSFTETFLAQKAQKKNCLDAFERARRLLRAADPLLKSLEIFISIIGLLCLTKQRDMLCKAFIVSSAFCTEMDALVSTAIQLVLQGMFHQKSEADGSECCWQGFSKPFKSVRYRIEGIKVRIGRILELSSFAGLERMIDQILCLMVPSDKTLQLLLKSADEMPTISHSAEFPLLLCSRKALKLRLCQLSRVDQPGDRAAAIDAKKSDLESSCIKMGQSLVVETLDSELAAWEGELRRRRQRSDLDKLMARRTAQELPSSSTLQDASLPKKGTSLNPADSLPNMTCDSSSSEGGFTRRSRPSDTDVKQQSAENSTHQTSIPKRSMQSELTEKLEKVSSLKGNERKSSPSSDQVQGLRPSQQSSSPLSPASYNPSDTHTPSQWPNFNVYANHTLPLAPTQVYPPSMPITEPVYAHPCNAGEHSSPFIDSFDTVRAEWEVEHVEVHLEKKVGSGAQASVFKGLWRGTEVAVKKMSTALSDPESFSKFQREIQILLKLRHPNLALLMGASVRSKPYFVLMEYCPGGDLFTLLHLPEKSAHPIVQLTVLQKLKIALDIAKGMNYLHKSHPQVIHRDLKSLNILLANVIRSKTDEPLAKGFPYSSCQVIDTIVLQITDFGLSQLRSGQPNELLCQTAAVGTCHWMAPEILTSQPYTEKVDIYSYGVLLYELFSQRIPYTSPPNSTSGQQQQGFMTNPINVALAVAQGKRPSISKVTRDCPVVVVSLMTGCWSHDPSLRPSFESILQTLNGIIQSLLVSKFSQS